MKQSDLKTIYGKFASELPTLTDGDDNITLSSYNLPLPPLEITTDDLYISKGEHFYNDWFKVDSVQFFARKETYRSLGLLILSTVFHPQLLEVSVKLNHSHSEIKKLSVKPHQNVNEWLTGYRTQPFSFEYYPKIAYLHPFNCFNCNINPRDLPCFNLANPQNYDDWNGRDTLEIFGSDAGLVLFAELLLNASLPQSEENEFALESESGGYRAVGVNSAEAVLYLPNHLAWIEEHWQENS